MWPLYPADNAWLEYVCAESVDDVERSAWRLNVPFNAFFELVLSAVVKAAKEIGLTSSKIKSLSSLVSCGLELLLETLCYLRETSRRTWNLLNLIRSLRRDDIGHTCGLI